MDDARPTRPVHRSARQDFRWDGVDLLPYKEDERALFKAITRQTLFSDPDLDGELRYFEVAPGGFSTLERHEHMARIAAWCSRILRSCFRGARRWAMSPSALR